MATRRRFAFWYLRRHSKISALLSHRCCCQRVSGPERANVDRSRRRATRSRPSCTISTRSSPGTATPPPESNRWGYPATPSIRTTPETRLLRRSAWRSNPPGRKSYHQCYGQDQRLQHGSAIRRSTDLAIVPRRNRRQDSRSDRRHIRRASEIDDNVTRAVLDFLSTQMQT